MKYIVAVFSILIGFVILLISLGATIPLDYFRVQIESSVGHLLDRKARIQGPILLSTSLDPTIKIENFSISNPQGWSQDSSLIGVQQGSLRLSLLPLFRGKILIDAIGLQGVELLLTSRKDSSTNYNFAFSDDSKDSNEEKYQLSGIRQLDIRDVEILYRDEAENSEYKLIIDQAVARAPPEQPMELSMQGTFSDQPYSLTLNADTLSELIRGTNGWTLSKGRLDIANTQIGLSGRLDRNTARPEAQGVMHINGTELNELSSLFGYTLAESGGFSLESEIDIQSKIIRLRNFKLQAFDSSALGTISYDFTETLPTLRGTVSIAELDTAKIAVSKALENSRRTPPPFAKPVSAQASSGTAKTPPLATPAPWNVLRAFNADLSLALARITHNGLLAKDLEIAAQLDNGELLMPVSFVYDDANVTGEIKINGAEDIPKARLSLSSDSVEIAPILKAFNGDSRFSGETGTLSLEARSQGKDIAALSSNIMLDLQLAGAYLDTEAGRMFTNKALSLTVKSPDLFSLSAHGSLNAASEHR